MTYAFQVEGLVKRFGKTTALAGIDLAARPGTVLGLLGPNGAGKTTVVRILATLLRPDGGTATVAGLDVVRQAACVLLFRRNAPASRPGGEPGGAPRCPLPRPADDRPGPGLAW